MSRIDPEILEKTLESPEKARLKLRLPADLLYFEGHFPAGAVLPGVVQIDWAMRYGREFFPVQGEYRGMETLKFQQLFQPGDEADLELEYKAAKNSVFFRYISAKGRHSSGSLLFGPA